MSSTQSGTVAGLSALTQLLQIERRRFAAAPHLLVTSRVMSNDLPHVAQLCRHASYLFQQQLGFRTVVATAKTMFPSQTEIDAAVQLATRVGASTVVACGSGNAIDFAKAIYQRHHSFEDMILIPATTGAALASGSRCSLLLDPVEETLFMGPLSTEKNERRTVVIPEIEAQGHHNTIRESLYACLTFAFDKLLANPNDDETLTLLSECVALLDATGRTPDSVSYQKAMRLCYSRGLSLPSELTSLPIHLAASMIPTNFSHYRIMTFFASLAPSLWSEIRRQELTENMTIDRIVTGAPRAVASTTIEELLNRITTKSSHEETRIRAIMANHVIL